MNWPAIEKSPQNAIPDRKALLPFDNLLSSNEDTKKIVVSFLPASSSIKMKCGIGPEKIGSISILVFQTQKENRYAGNRQKVYR
jgi:hypothetical protein